MMVDNSINRRTMIQLTKIKFMKCGNNYTNQFEFNFQNIENLHDI